MAIHRRGWRAALALLGLSTLSACVVAPYDYYGYGYNGYGYYPGYYGSAGETLAVTDVPPPAPYYEVQPVAPFVGAVWIGGYWNWYGGRHVWAPGYWAHPRPGYVWHPYRWAPYGGGRWTLHSGGWGRMR
ncbi:MAG TPA: hypothetical protein VFK10_14650 [Burkholderiaceae bacterium]|nr:hypothetical protein [Burkholderiaceae bacterium]